MDLFLGHQLDPHVVFVGPRILVAAVDVDRHHGGERPAFGVLAAEFDLMESGAGGGEQELGALAAGKRERGGRQVLAARLVAHRGAAVVAIDADLLVDLAGQLGFEFQRAFE